MQVEMEGANLELSADIEMKCIPMLCLMERCLVGPQERSLTEDLAYTTIVLG